jgi:threonine aldolase
MFLAENRRSRRFCSLVGKEPWLADEHAPDEPVAGERDADAILDRCTRSLAHGPTIPLSETLEAIAEEARAGERADRYGGGSLIEDFEREIAGLLGKESAAFMPSGTMAQQCALRVWADRTANRAIGLHPTSHLVEHEEDGYSALHGLQRVVVGAPHAVMTPEDVDTCPLRLGALVIELPHREIGGLLPSWDDLVTMTTIARERGFKLHMDGARLWESAPAYGRELAEIAGLFDTVYVSMYKMLGGIAGAVLSGPADVITEAKSWRHRHGGTLVTMAPMVLSARKGLRETLPRIPAYLERAREVAAELAAIDGMHVVPTPPHTPMMHLFIPADGDALWRAALDIAEEQGVRLIHRPSPTVIPGLVKIEITIREGASAFAPGEVQSLFEDLLERARRAPGA